MTIKINKNLAIETKLVNGVHEIFKPKRHPKASSLYDLPLWMREKEKTERIKYN